MADIVGAEPSEVAVMGSLTANLHLLMGSFYRPTTHRYKIMIEGKAFPSDRYLVESQIRSHNLDPTDALIVVEPEDPERHTLTTKEILLEIQKHGDSVAVLLFPAVSYFTGQVFDMRMITRFAHAKGIIVGFDLAHAAGNIKMNLHEWGVDFAAWCCYKYLNSGPGGIAAIFVHEKHGKVDAAKGSDGYHPRLAGWWGHKQETRFAMGAEFVPIPGAAGYQVSNPSVLDMTALKASLNIFSQTSMDELVTKSEVMTNYLLNLLDVILRCHKMPVSEQAEAFMLVRLQAWFRDGPISLCSYVAPWCQELMARHCVALVRGDVTITEVCRYPNRNGAWDAALMEILMSIYQNAVNHKLVPSIAKLKEPKPEGFEEPAFSIITPLAAKERGNMVSIKVRPDLIEHVLVHLAQHKCIIDVRKPDVIRIAPTPLYNTFRDIWRFYEALDRGINCTLKGTTDHVAKPPPRPDSSSGQPCCLFCG